MRGERRQAIFFSELCGNSGLSPALKNVKGDATTLIEVARIQKLMQTEINHLKTQVKQLTSPKTQGRTTQELSFFPKEEEEDRKKPGSKSETYRNR